MTRWVADTKIPMEREEMTFLAISLERHLSGSGCPPERYDEVYEAGMKEYMSEGYGKGPFNIFYVLRAWDIIRESEGEAKEKFDPAEDERIRQEARASRKQCDTCKGTGIVWTTDDNGRKSILYEEQDGKKTTVKCPEC